MERSRWKLWGRNNSGNALSTAEQPQKSEWKERDDIELPIGVARVDGKLSFITNSRVLIVGSKGISAELPSNATGRIESKRSSIDLTLLPPSEDDSQEERAQRIGVLGGYDGGPIFPADLEILEQGYSRQKKESPNDRELLERMEFRIEYARAEIDSGYPQDPKFDKLRIKNLQGEVKIVVQDPDVQVRILIGDKEITGKPPEEARQEITVAAKSVQVDYRPANDPQVDEAIQKDEREMAEIMEAIEKILDLRADLGTLKKLLEALTNANAPEILMGHMTIIGNVIAREEHTIEEERDKADVRSNLPLDLLASGMDILKDRIIDMAHDKGLSSDNAVVVSLLNELGTTYAQEEHVEQEVDEEDLSDLFRKLKRFERKGGPLSDEELADVTSDYKYKDWYWKYDGGNVVVRIGTHPGEQARILRDKDDHTFHIIGNIEELKVLEDYQVLVRGNAQKIEANGNAVVEVEGKVAAAVALDESEVYASGRIKRKRQFGKSVIKDYDPSLTFNT